MSLALTLLPQEIIVCQLDPGAPTPELPEGFSALLRTPGELTLICEKWAAPSGAIIEEGWRVLVVQGPFEFSTVGILSELSACLAAAGISILALSSYDTDHILVKQDFLNITLVALHAGGHRVIQPE